MSSVLCKVLILWPHLGRAGLPLHLSHPVGHSGLCSLGQLRLSLASSHFYAFCCLVELKKTPQGGCLGSSKNSGWLQSELVSAGLELGNAWAGQGRLWEAAAAAELSWVSGPGQLLLNPPWSDVPRAGVLWQKWGRAGSMTSPCPALSTQHIEVLSSSPDCDSRHRILSAHCPWECPNINHGLCEVSFFLQKLLHFALYSVVWAWLGAGVTWCNIRERIFALDVLTLLHKVVTGTKWNSSARKQNWLRNGFQLHLKGSCPNFCPWGHSMTYGDMLKVRGVIFGAERVAWREGILKCCRKVRKLKGGVGFDAQKASQWCVLVKQLQAKVDIKSDDKHTLVLRSASFFRNVKSFVVQQKELEFV